MASPSQDLRRTAGAVDRWRDRLSRVTHALMVPPRALRRAWRRSLTLRVTTTTLVLSTIVMTVLGVSLLSRVTTGLLDAKVTSSVAEATAGLGEARRILDAADTGPSSPSPAQLVDAVTAALAARSGTPGQFDLLLLSTGPTPNAPERGTNLATPASVPPDLRAAVAGNQRQAWAYTDIRTVDGGTQPGLAVGQPIYVPTIGQYELYYLFPLAQEQSTLDLVRSAVIFTGLLLIGLLAAVALVVVRQVVNPVRAAARTAERFSRGYLSERMRVRGEDDLARLAQSFNAMAASLAGQIKQLEDLSRVQQRFVSDVSHELRTPLTTIRMAADVMFDDRRSFDAPTARAVELLQAQLDRFESLLADLLEISRFDAGAAVLDAELIDLGSLTRRAVDASKDLADRLGVEIRLEEPLEPVTAQADARRVHRILRNLLDNAIEHADPSTGVEVTMGVNEAAVAILVRDRGVGLRPGESALVFNRFWRADPARARTTGGTGLGLAISLEDARLHGGWLEAAGEPGRGAVFRLTLPRVVRAAIVASPLPISDEVELPPRPDFAPSVIAARASEAAQADPDRQAEALADVLDEQPSEANR